MTFVEGMAGLMGTAMGQAQERAMDMAADAEFSGSLAESFKVIIALI